ncbi:hypothetical protein [Micromonospora sp. DH14]|uniref:hypothetical protein n=1 Tax=Micromonospora sp. DH14 TaxID=3040120 RepID=UPI00244297F6|nr:hypothetical protein [Micromonospora sp. DH14]MDG9673028.1 hypothetical protein [Micromonospora sp. DH14]
MTPTLVLEQLMLHPRFNELATLTRAITPVGLVDQTDRATEDARQVMAAEGHGVKSVDASSVPGWLRLGLLDVYAQWAAGTADTCRHQPAVDRPMPVIAAAWRPGLVVCPACVHLTGLPRGADTTCDACGHQCGDLAHGDGIYADMIQLGPLIYQYGTCGDCRPAITAQSSPPSATQTAEPATPRGTGRARPARPHNRRRRPR